MLYLKAMNPEDAAAEYACLQDLPGENGFTNEAYGIPFACLWKKKYHAGYAVHRGGISYPAACRRRISFSGMEIRPWRFSRCGIF